MVHRSDLILDQMAVREGRAAVLRRVERLNEELAALKARIIRERGRHPADPGGAKDFARYCALSNRIIGLQAIELCRGAK